MAHFTPKNEELYPEATVEGDGRWEMEANEKRGEKGGERREQKKKCSASGGVKLHIQRGIPTSRQADGI
jgi:hypothetical protein